MTNELEHTLGQRWEVHGQLGERKPRIVNTCSCGIKYTLSEFSQLHLVGRSEYNGDDGPIILEQRNCTCGSTRAIECQGNGEVSNE
jgi:hypothetical protein